MIIEVLFAIELSYTSPFRYKWRKSVVVKKLGQIGQTNTSNWNRKEGFSIVRRYKTKVIWYITKAVKIATNQSELGAKHVTGDKTLENI